MLRIMNDELQFFFDRGGEISDLSFRRYAQEVDPRWLLQEVHPRINWHRSEQRGRLSDQISRGAIRRIGVRRDPFIPYGTWRLKFDLLVDSAHCSQGQRCPSE